MKCAVRCHAASIASGPERTANAAAAKRWRTPGPTYLVLLRWQRALFKTLLEEEGLRFDRRPRTAYSLRHTYISLRLMEGADIYQNAKNCRASVEMIEVLPGAQ